MFTRVPVDAASRDSSGAAREPRLPVSARRPCPGTRPRVTVIPGPWRCTRCLCEDPQSLLQTREGQSESVGRMGREERACQSGSLDGPAGGPRSLGTSRHRADGGATEGPMSWSSQPSPARQLLGHRLQTAGTIPIHGQRLKQQTPAARARGLERQVCCACGNISPDGASHESWSLHPSRHFSETFTVSLHLQVLSSLCGG